MGVPGRNVSGERLLEMCSELELRTGNQFFRKRGINKFTLQRIDNEMFVERALMDYVIVKRVFWVGWWMCMYQNGLEEGCLNIFQR